jgi:hypothetical protein
MTAIDVGTAATDRSDGWTAGYTFIDRHNSANDTGTITSIEVWCASEVSNFEVGTFYGSGTTYTCRAAYTVGTVTAGSKQTKVVSLSVSTGDFIGGYFTGGTVEASATGATTTGYYRMGDNVAASESHADWSSMGNYLWSLYGTGTTPTGTKFQINIGDAWKAVAGMQINIGDAWKAVAGAKINIGDAWKTIF